MDPTGAPLIDQPTVTTPSKIFGCSPRYVLVFCCLVLLIVMPKFLHTIEEFYGMHVVFEFVVYAFIFSLALFSAYGGLAAMKRFFDAMVFMVCFEALGLVINFFGVLSVLGTVEYFDYSYEQKVMLAVYRTVYAVFFLLALNMTVGTMVLMIIVMRGMAVEEAMKRIEEAMKKKKKSLQEKDAFTTIPLN